MAHSCRYYTLFDLCYIIPAENIDFDNRQGCYVARWKCVNPKIYYPPFDRGPGLFYGQLEGVGEPFII